MSRNKLTQFILDKLIWFILLLVVVFFALSTDNFLTGINTINILLHASVLGVLTIGQALCLMSGNFDLSAEGTVSLVTVLAAWLMLPYREMSVAQAGGVGWQVSPFVVIPIMLAIGTLAGWINGVLITRLQMNNFIVTLAMQLILRGIAFVISMGAIMPGTPATFNWLGGGRIGPIPVSVIVTLLLFVIFAAVLHYTRFGRELYAVGANKDAARASGFKPKVTVTQAYMISGLLAGLAGWMLLGRLEASNPTLGQGMTLETVAAAVIGGVALTGGSGTIAGAFAGVLLLSVIADGLNLMAVNPFWIDGVRGLIILVALLLEAQKVRIQPRLFREQASHSAASAPTSGGEPV
jgi:ribose/xylose/arabinose/galactoside ABC-type transport system permease subunit